MSAFRSGQSTLIYGCPINVQERDQAGLRKLIYRTSDKAIRGYPVHAMNKTEALRPPLENVAMVAKLEERLLQDRNTVEKMGDAIGSFAGSMSFLVLHVVIFAVWFLVNTRIVWVSPHLIRIRSLCSAWSYQSRLCSCSPLS